jgi:hypothetical protein
MPLDRQRFAARRCLLFPPQPSTKVNHMKIKFLITLAAAAAVMAAVQTAPAQTTNNSAGPTQPNLMNDTAQNNFVSTAGSWLTTIDYSKSWPTNEMNFSVGALWINNVNWANYILGEKHFGNWITDAQMANQGIAGTIARVQGGGGYRLLNRGDLAINATIDLGYQRASVDVTRGSAAFVEPNLTLRKLMAHGAFAEISLNYDAMLKGPQPAYPGLRVGTGFTF